METVKANELLNKAAAIMEDRAALYDKPEGERSMGKTVEAFNAITGQNMTESEGWLLMELLKNVRLWQRPGYHADSAEDCVAYAALKAEAKSREANAYTVAPIEIRATQKPAEPTDDGESRIDDGNAPMHLAEAAGALKYARNELRKAHGPASATFGCIACEWRQTLRVLLDDFEQFEAAMPDIAARDDERKKKIAAIERGIAEAKRRDNAGKQVSA